MRHHQYTTPSPQAGTPHYLPPEVCLLDTSIFNGGKADIFSAGLVLAEMILGRHPLEFLGR